VTYYDEYPRIHPADAGANPAAAPPMSLWTHNICWDCWNEQEGRPRQPSLPKLGETPSDVCCWCGKPNTDGIYKRADPEETRCKGKHDEIR
jgi:hypothetical protein